MEKNEKQQDSTRSSYVQALQIFSEISTWIVVPIVVALAVGKTLDSHLGTKPWIFIVLAFCGFIFSSMKIVKIVKSYADSLTNKDNESN